MNLPEEKFVAKKPSKYDLLKQAVNELLDGSTTVQTYPCECGSYEMVHIFPQDWEEFKDKVKLAL